MMIKSSFLMRQRLPSASARRIVTVIIFIAVLLVYWKHGLQRLEVFPPLQQDEQLIASVAYKMAREGVLGTDLFVGYYRMENRLYDFMPLYPLLESWIFKFSGFGPFQMRLLSVCFGSLLLVLVFIVGLRLNGLEMASIAMSLMVFLRLARGVDLSGIPLLDSSRVNRYDLGVPVFGLLAFLCFLESERRGKWIHIVAGFLIGLATMTHAYGVLWLPALLLVLSWQGNWGIAFCKDAFRLLGGFVLACLPWLVYILSDWSNYVGQNLMVVDRFQLLSPWFYLDNLIHEVDRYRALNLRHPGGSWDLTRVGTVGAAAGLALALWRSWHQRREQPHIFALALVLVMQALMFAFLIKPKLFVYTISLWPLAVLLLSWVGVILWQKKTAVGSRILLAAVGTAMLAEGASRIGHTSQVARTTSSYAQFAAELATHIPQNATVLGLHHYWMGLHHLRYRSWLLPLLLSNPLHYKLEPLALYEALDRIHPDIILLDTHMREYFELISDRRDPNHGWFQDYRRYMVGHQATLLATVNDPTYGSVEIFQLHSRTVK